MTSLSLLADEVGLELHGHDLFVTGVAQSSDLVKPGYLFAALSGAKHHGLDFANQAIQQGAVALLVDKSDLERALEFGLPVLVADHALSILGKVCSQVYDLSGLKLFAVTGTNGKTSTVTYLAWLINKLGTSCGFSASTMRRVGQEHISSSLTTPQVAEMYDLLSQMKQAGNKSVVVEVSAQALIRHRIDGLRFAVAGFTNLSRDHLDDFESMEHYLAAKKLLFTEHADFSVINIEDSFGASLRKDLSDAIGIGSDRGEWHYKISRGIPAELEISIRGHSISCLVPAGAIMAKNLALAIAMAAAAGFQIDAIQEAIKSVDVEVPGRLQRVSNHAPAVYVDYAHTPAGVEAAAGELRDHYKELVVVLGASGNRDQGKRAAMAHAACVADLLIITDQHPRDEDPAEIRKTLVTAALSKLPANQVEEIANPQAAIERAIGAVSNEGAVLWCGPGHLTYREVAGKKVAFNAVEIARSLVEAQK